MRPDVVGILHPGRVIQLPVVPSSGGFLPGGCPELLPGKPLGEDQQEARDAGSPGKVLEALTDNPLDGLHREDSAELLLQPSHDVAECGPVGERLRSRRSPRAGGRA